MNRLTNEWSRRALMRVRARLIRNVGLTTDARNNVDGIVFKTFSLPLKRCLGRSLDAPYYSFVAGAVGAQEPDKLWAYRDEALSPDDIVSNHCFAFGFTGTQDISNHGFRVTFLLAQVASALGACTVSGNAYGVDMAVVLGTLQRDEVPIHPTAAARPIVNHVVALPSGIESRSPQIHVIERAVLHDRGLYLSLLESSAPLLGQLLSPRDRLIVDLSDVLVFTEAGDRGAFDTIIWSFEAQKPVVVVDWSGTEDRKERCGYRILRELMAQAGKSPGTENVSVLAPLLLGALTKQTCGYDFSSAHPTERERDQPTFSENRPGYRSPEQLAGRLIELARSYRACGREIVQFVDQSDITPRHEWDRIDISKKASRAAEVLRPHIGR